MKKCMSGIVAISLIMGGLSAAAQIDNLSSTSILVCRSHQCANASYSMTKGFLFNKIAQMMEQNIGKTVLVCEADPATHICLTEGLSIPTDTSYSPVPVTIDQMKLVDEKKLNGYTGLDLVWDYRIKADRTYPSCQLALSRLKVDYTDKAELTTTDFLCNMTELGQTAVNATYNIDYLDFDYGFIGAYYTIGVGGAVRGDKTGYALFRFTARPPVATMADTVLPVPTTPVVQQVPQPVVQEKIETTEPVIQKIEVPVPTPLPQSEKVETKPTRIVPEIVIRQEPAPVSAPVAPEKPTVIKTTTVEKMVITSDGRRQVTPPEVRTIVNGKTE